jgi:RING finger family protein
VCAQPTRSAPFSLPISQPTNLNYKRVIWSRGVSHRPGAALCHDDCSGPPQFLERAGVFFKTPLRRYAVSAESHVPNKGPSLSGIAKALQATCSVGRLSNFLSHSLLVPPKTRSALSESALRIPGPPVAPGSLPPFACLRHRGQRHQRSELELSRGFHAFSETIPSERHSNNQKQPFIMADQCIVCLESLDSLAKSPSPSSGAEAAASDPAPGGATATRPTESGSLPSPTTAAADAAVAGKSTGPLNHDSIAVIDICGHTLHDTCLREWTGKANSCPICRQAFHLVHVYDKVGGELPPHARPPRVPLPPDGSGRLC